MGVAFARKTKNMIGATSSSYMNKGFSAPTLDHGRRRSGNEWVNDVSHDLYIHNVSNSPQ